MKKAIEDQFSAETLSIVGGHDPAKVMNSIKNPIFQTSTFKFNTAEEGKAFFTHQTAPESLEQRFDLQQAQPSQSGSSRISVGQIRWC